MTTPEQRFREYNQMTDAQLLVETGDWSDMIRESQLCLAAIWSVRKLRETEGVSTT